MPFPSFFLGGGRGENHVFKSMGDVVCILLDILVAKREPTPGYAYVNLGENTGTPTARPQLSPQVGVFCKLANGSFLDRPGRKKFRVGFMVVEMEMGICFGNAPFLHSSC